MHSPGSKPIRLAFLGADAGSPALARAVLDSTQFVLVGVCEASDVDERQFRPSLRELTARAGVIDQWETLLDRAQVNAVIVARGDDQERRAEQLRKLIQEGVPLLVSHPIVDSMLVYHELDMIRRETSSVVLPYLPARLHPAVVQLAVMVEQPEGSPIGKIDQVLVQRSIIEPSTAKVIAHFARDVDLLRRIAGDMTRLGAMGGTSEHLDYVGLGVQMSGPAGIVARWSIDPNQFLGGARLSLLGAQGNAVLEISAEDEPGTLEIAAGGRTDVQQFPSWNPAAVALSQLAAAIAGQSIEPDWIDAARSVELAETIDRSLKKGRTIELYYEDYTEQGTFKGIMTSLGCGLLVLGMVMLAVVAIAEQAGLPYVRLWPYAFLGVFGVFLLLQLLMLVFREKDDPQAVEAASLPGQPPRV